MTKKILLVEDSDSIIESLGILLKRSGYDFVGISEAEKAMKVIQKEKPDLIMLDLMMPIIPGGVLFKEIKKKKELRKIPIMILSGKAFPLEEEPFLKEADDLIVKPFDINDLLQRIDKCLR